MMVRVKKKVMTPMRLMKPLLWMLVAFYMGYHMMHGERGLLAMMRDKRELVQLQQDFTETKAQREKMELRVSHLRDGSLDRDLLDEQMRRMMGVMNKGEIVVLTGKSS
ncbi:MAG: FtsB family cell division protein [Rickettsiales bacterium]